MREGLQTYTAETMTLDWPRARLHFIKDPNSL